MGSTAFLSLISSLCLEAGWSICQALQPPAEAEWIHNVKCLFWYHRWEKRGGLCQCWKHHHITVGLVEYSQHFKTRLLYSQKRKEKWGKLWWKVRLWRCWFAAEWTEAFRSCREAQVGATWLFICNVTFKQRAPCHRDYSIFLWIMPKHCAHVKTHTYTQARSASGWQKL